MAISITSAVRENGPVCDHLTVTVNVEGVNKTFKTSFAEIDGLPMASNEDLKEIVIRWAKYRRSQNRTILNVDIA